MKYCKQHGVTLLEVLATVVVVGIGLASIANMVITGVRGTSSAQTRSQATILADQLAETMRANLLAYETGEFASEPAVTSTECLTGTNCEPDIQARFDTTKWKYVAAGALPGGKVTICMDSTPDDGEPANPSCDGIGFNTIKLFWRDSRHEFELPEDQVYYRLVMPVIP